jgi:hypothetical protein
LSSTGKTVSANPDLGFGDKPIFIGDVKYKIQDDKWRRPDLAQSVFFAVAFDSSKSLIIDFENENSKPNGDLQVSQIQVSALGWNARSDSSPEDSAEQLVDKVKNWLEGSELLFVSELKVT